MNLPVRVLHVFGQMAPGGAEMRFLDVISRLRPAEFRIDVCALSGKAGSLDGRVRTLGGRVVPLRFDVRFPRRFLSLLEHGRYDVVHSNVLHSSGPILALAKKAGVPVRVAHFHVTEDGHRSSLRRRAHRALMCHLIDRYATDIVACGEGAMVGIWRPDWMKDPRCRVIHYGLDLARFEQPVDVARVRTGLGIPTSAPLFLHLGRESPDDQKNHRRVVAMFQEIRKREPEAWLVLAGAGTDHPEGETRRAMRELGIDDHVLALGVRDDIPQLLKAADTLLLPSRFEGLPGVVLEACAVGVPVLATDIPGTREIGVRLPLVRCLPLTLPDGEWAAAAVALPGEASRLRLRERSTERFRSSAFSIDRAVEANCTIWARHVAQLGARILACS